MRKQSNTSPKYQTCLFPKGWKQAITFLQALNQNKMIVKNVQHEILVIKLRHCCKKKSSSKELFKTIWKVIWLEKLYKCISALANLKHTGVCSKFVLMSMCFVDVWWFQKCSFLDVHWNYNSKQKLRTKSILDLTYHIIDVCLSVRFNSFNKKERLLKYWISKLCFPYPHLTRDLAFMNSVQKHRIDFN